jgi:hypothetical protein
MAVAFRLSAPAGQAGTGSSERIAAHSASVKSTDTAAFAPDDQRRVAVRCATQSHDRAEQLDSADGPAYNCDKQGLLAPCCIRNHELPRGPAFMPIPHEDHPIR